MKRLTDIKDGDEFGFMFGSQSVGVEVVRQWMQGSMPYIRLQVVECDAGDAPARDLVCGFFIDCPLDNFKAIAWQYEDGERLTFIPDAPLSNGMVIEAEVA